MKRCLACHEPYIERPSWRKLFQLEKESLICEECEQKLIELKGDGCQGCYRQLDGETYQQEGVCYDCLRWEENEQMKNVLTRNVSLYKYNDFLKEWLSTYKFRGDAIIASFFSQKLERAYIQYFNNYLPVAIPLSEQRLLERGFNQSELLMAEWSTHSPILIRKTGDKQSKKGRIARIKQVGHSPFSMNPLSKTSVEGLDIVLIDDIYTTGTTVRQAASTLKKHGAENIVSLTIAR